MPGDHTASADFTYVLACLFSAVARTPEHIPEAAQTYLPQLARINQPGPEGAQAQLFALGRAAGQRHPEYWVASLALMALSGQMVTQALRQPRGHRHKAVGAALSFALLADMAQPVDAVGRPLRGFGALVRRCYEPILLLGEPDLAGLARTMRDRLGQTSRRAAPCEERPEQELLLQGARQVLRAL